MIDGAKKMFVQAGVFALLASALGGGVAYAATPAPVPDHQDAPVLERYERQVRKAGEHAEVENTLRIAGRDRYETAALISQSVWNPEDVGVVFLASGEQFPDALALGPVTAGVGPLLLAGSGMPYATLTELQRLQPCVVVIVGGEDRIPGYVQQEAGWNANPNQAKCDA